MAEFVLSRLAGQDLIDLWTFIAEDNIDAADAMVSSIEEATGRLAEMPGMGHTRKDLTSQDVLFWPVKFRIVIYRNREPLEVVRILSAYRNIAALLG